MSSMTGSWQPEMNGSGHLPRGTTRGYGVRQMAAGTAMTLETLRVEIRAEIQKYKTDLKRAETATTTSSNRMKTALQAVKTALGAIGVVTGLMAAITKVVQLGKESLELASDLQEVQNVVDVTFGNMSGQIDEFATNAITQFGLSQTSAKQYASTIGAMLKSMGFQGQQLTDMSMDLAGLAGDLASFYNLDTDTAFAKIRAGISGETEPLKQLGINLSVANLEAYALSQGITTAYNAMSQQEQALLRYNYLLQATGDAQGDFSRTSDGWANQVRIMREQINALKAEIGSGLMEILLPIVRGINWLLTQVIRGLQVLRRAFSRGKGGTSSMDDMTGATAALTSEANAASGAIGGIGKAAKSAAKALTNASFDELHQLANPNSGSGGSGGGGGGGGAFSGMLDGIEEEVDGLTQITEKSEQGENAVRSFVRALFDTQRKVNYEIGRAWVKSPANQGIQAYNDAYVEFNGAIGEKLMELSRSANETRARGGVISDLANASMWGRVKKNLTGGVASLKNFVTGSAEAQEGIRRFNEASVNGFHDLAVALGLVEEDADDAREGIDTATRGIKEDLAKINADANLKDFGNKVTGLGKNMTSSAVETGTAAGAISRHLRDMNVNASKPISDFRNAAKGVGTEMTNAGTTTKTAANNVVSHLTTMKTNGTSQTEALRSTLASKFGQMRSNAGAEAEAMRKAIVDKAGAANGGIKQINFGDAGQHIKNGLIAGMGDFKYQLDNWANQFKGRILKNFKIKSPSRWMRDEVGVYLGEGMALGMTDSMSEIVKACETIGDAITGTFEDVQPEIQTPLLAGMPAVGSPMLQGTASMYSMDGRSGNWIELLASTIAQRMGANETGQNERPIVCEVYLDRDRIATAVSRGQQAQNRRYSSTAMA